ncbi:MAG: DUF2252 domain-containing protein [Acidimicrobiia bacterium]|nr:DUF2252 domain-containing protein [Acidimicrobiia bacterium]
MPNGAPDRAALFDAERLTRSDLVAFGQSRRRRTARGEHGRWRPPASRRDPLEILRAQDASRVQELVPIRYGRMLRSPFTFFRGSAAVMAADLAGTPTSGINVQACGDAHAENFGVYASPERQIVFDVNDFDETLPGPWEWDLKRLATSMVLAAEADGLGKRAGRDAAETIVHQYQAVLRRLARDHTVSISYEQMNSERFLRVHDDNRSRKILKRILHQSSKRTNEQAVRKWVRWSDGLPRFIDEPPLLEHLAPEVEDQFHTLVNRYRATLQDNRRHVLEQYRFRDVARKVVGVGSVGMRAYIFLMQGRGGDDDLLVLQAKEAVSSVLTPYCGPSGFARHGQRVVVGQRLMQSASDPFLGWAPFAAGDYYVRQLRDHKGPGGGAMVPYEFELTSLVLGGTLARAHARSVDPGALIGYIGSNDRLARSIAQFAMRYTDQVEEDYDRLNRAVRDGSLRVERGI